MNIIFFGTPYFSKIILEKLIQTSYRPALVITAPDKPVGRKKILTPPPTKVLAQKHAIKIWQPEKLNIENWKSEIGKLRNVDLAIVVAYGKIIPKSILNTLPAGFINVHPSLLPKYRGPSPIQSAILNGDEKTGVTIMLLDEKMDHGPILASREYPRNKEQGTNKSQIPMTKITTPELSDILAEEGAELLVETIPKWINKEIEPKEQNHNKATYTKIITREDGRVDWKKPAQYIERQLRALTPWPGIFTFWKDKRLKIISLHIAAKKSDSHAIGQLVPYKDSFAVQTGAGFVVPKIVQLEGKKPQSAEEFLKGHSSILGNTLS